MDLLLWRHADAELAVPGEDDAARRLSARGQRQATRMSAWLNHQLPEQCIVLCSPALRCVQTAEALGRKFRTVPALAPDSSAEAILAAAGWPGRRTPVLIVGHQPLLGQVAALLIANEKQAWPVRKGSVIWIGQKAAAPGQSFLRAVLGPELVTR